MVKSNQATLESLPAGLADALAQPRAYPHDPSAPTRVTWRQTHISHVFLTADRVYKLRKAVDLGFLSFATRRKRNQDCLREVKLNRRLAPDVYLGLAPVRKRAGKFELGPCRETLETNTEHCVVMRRLPAGRDALSLLQKRKLHAERLDAVAHKLARFHQEQRLATPAPFSTKAWHARIADPVLDNFALMRDEPVGALPQATLSRAESLARQYLEEHAKRFERRRLAGAAVDGHGDLHLEHVWFETDTSDPLMIDCLEFREDLRQIDAASDVAFLAMDLQYRGRKKLSERFLRSYAAESDDFALYETVDYYASYRAAVRAKVAALAARDSRIRPAQRKAAQGSARRHLSLAARLLSPPPRGAILAVCGIVGTGKSSVAEVLADAVNGVVIASDRVRKYAAGLEAGQRTHDDWQSGMYSAQSRRRIYAALLDRARSVLASGRVVILDASYAQRSRRNELVRFARKLDVPVQLVEVRCSQATALKRLAKRAVQGDSFSDAGPELYARFARAFQATTEWPSRQRAVLHTDRAGWRRRARDVARKLRKRAR